MDRQNIMLLTRVIAGKKGGNKRKGEGGGFVQYASVALTVLLKCVSMRG